MRESADKHLSSLKTPADGRGFPSIEHWALPAGYSGYGLKDRLLVLEDLKQIAETESSSFRFFSILSLRYAIFSVMSDEEKRVVFEMVKPGLKSPLDNFAPDYVDFLGRFYFCVNDELKEEIISLACSAMNGSAQETQLFLSFAYFSERVRFSANSGQLSMLLQRLSLISEKPKTCFFHEAVSRAAARLRAVDVRAAE